MIQAVTDVALGTPAEKREVARWLVTPHFIEVCEAAGMCPLRVTNLMRQLQAEEDRRQRVWFITRMRERLYAL